MTATRSAGFVERRLDQWLTQQKIQPTEVSSSQLGAAASDLGFSVDELQKARQSLAEKSAAAVMDQGASAKNALALGAGSSAASSGNRLASGPVGVRFGLTKSEPMDLRTVGKKFDDLANQLRKQPGSMKSLVPSFSSLSASLSAQIKALEDERSPIADRLDKKEAQLGWFQRNVGLFTPREVKDLRRTVENLDRDIGESKAFRGGANIALAKDRGVDPDMDPASLQSKLDTAASAIPQSGEADVVRKKGVAGLVKAQDQVRGVADRAQLALRAIDADVSDFSKEVKWHQKWKWVDVVIGGESGRGALFRMGKELEKGASALAGDLEGIAQAGEQRTISELNELLKIESPKYRDMRAQYDKLEPAYKGAVSVLHAASEAQDALESAEYWIDRRNMLKMMEPTQYEWVEEKRADGSVDRRQQETSAHQSWESQFNHANWQAQWEASRAESEVKDVNQGLPRLSEALGKLGGPKNFLPQVNEDIGAFWGQFMSLGIWSYDSSNVSQMQNQLRKLEGQVHEIKGRLEPDYTKHRDWVFSEIDKRRGQLRAEA